MYGAVGRAHYEEGLLEVARGSVALCRSSRTASVRKLVALSMGDRRKA